MNSFDGVIWRRLKYMLTPQWDLYRNIAKKITDANVHVNAVSDSVRVLDVGCGNGFGTQMLWRQDRHVFGLDSDKHAIRFARESFPHVTFTEADVTNEEDDRRRHDAIQVVTCIEVIEHWPKQKTLAFLRWVMRELKPQLFFCSTINYDAEYRKSDEHVHGYNARQFRELFNLCWTGCVTLTDYTLEESIDDGSTRTPLVATCTA